MQSRLQPMRDNFRKIWQGITGRFTDYIAPTALENIVLGIFDCYTPEELYEGIVGGVDIWGEDWGEFEEFRIQFQLLASDPRFSKHIQLLTVENVLEWLRNEKGRPKLASVIINTPAGTRTVEVEGESTEVSHPSGVEWLIRQIDLIKAGLAVPIEGVASAGEGEVVPTTTGQQKATLRPIRRAR